MNTLPARHHLILTGDFNSPAPQVRGLVGTKADAHPTPAVADLRLLEDLDLDFQLLHLNSWVRTAGLTFTSPQASSLIDHIFVRRTQADSPARTARPFKWPPASWRQGGRHWPVQASVPIRAYRTLRHDQPKRLLLDLQGLRSACRNPNHAAAPSQLSGPIYWPYTRRLG